MAVPKSITVASPAPSPAPVATPASPDDAILALIERAARDPAVDIDKMERLFGMHERMKATNAKAAFLAALAQMQAEMPAVARRGKAHNDKKYARFEDIVETVRAPLQNHGFSLTFRLEQQTDKLRVTGVLGHSGGHAEQTDILLSADASGSKNAVQAWGSSVSYGKRYVAMALLGIATEDDDDGKAAGSGAPLSAEQMTELQRLIDAHAVDVPAFCDYFGIAVVSALPAAKFEAAKSAILRRKR